jgi:hypothetical protein
MSNADRKTTSDGGREPASVMNMPDAFAAMEQMLEFQQQMLRTGLISSEMMRVGLNHVRRNVEFANLVGQGLSSLGATQAEFLQRVAKDTVEDWQRVTQKTSGWMRDQAGAVGLRAV